MKIEPQDVEVLRPLADQLAELIIERIESRLLSPAIKRELWTAAEVAQSIGVSVATVHELAKEKDGIPPVDVSERMLRFRPEDVQAFAERKLRRPHIAGMVRNSRGSPERVA